MIKSQDIHLSDLTLKNQFVSYFKSGDYTNAFNILSSNSQLDTKKFVDVVLNEISTEILYLEQLYYTNVDNFLASEIIRLQTAINNYKYMVAYSGATQYAINNFVLYNSLVYLCYVIPPVGTLPTNTTYWKSIGLKGDKGADSINTNLRYDWSISTTYAVKDVVLYQNIFYVAKQINTGKIPPSNTTEWEVYLTKNLRYIHTEATDTLLTVGDVWYKPL